MKFNRILEQYVRESEALTKIIMKVDPKNTKYRDFRDLDGYEGYILREGAAGWLVLFENIDLPIADVPMAIMQVVDVPCDEALHNIKMFALKMIEERKGLTMEIMNKIYECNSIEFLEQFLKEEGLNDSEIKDVYKKALSVNSMISEGIGDTIKGAYNKASNIYNKATKFYDNKLKKPLGVAATVAGAILAPDAAAAKYLNKFVKKDKKDSNTIPVPNVVKNLLKDSSPEISIDPKRNAYKIIKTFNQYADDVTGDYYYNKTTRDVFRLTTDLSTSNIILRAGNIGTVPVTSYYVDIDPIREYLQNKINAEAGLNYKLQTLPLVQAAS